MFLFLLPSPSCHCDRYLRKQCNGSKGLFWLMDSIHGHSSIVCGHTEGRGRAKLLISIESESRGGGGGMFPVTPILQVMQLCPQAYRESSWEIDVLMSLDSSQWLAHQPSSKPSTQPLEDTELYPTTAGAGTVV